MRRSLFVCAAALACAALAACAPIAGLTTVASTSPPAAVTVAIADTGTGVDAAYNVVARLYLAAVPAMPVATKAKVKPLLVQAYAYVQAADAAAAVGDSATLAARIAAATELIGQAQSILSPAA